MIDKNNKIDTKDLEKVTGGLIFNAHNVPGADPDNPWEVIDNFTGEVLDTFPTKKAAMENARSYGGDPYNVLEVPDYDSLIYLRNHPKMPN